MSIELSPDGARLYLIANWQTEPGRGVWAIEARTGSILGHMLSDVRVTGIAVDAAGTLFVASPDAGGRLWSLPHGDPRRRRLLRDGPGDGLSGVLVGS